MGTNTGAITAHLAEALPMKRLMKAEIRTKPSMSDIPPSPEAFGEVYRRVLDHSDIVSLHISRKLSLTVERAHQAAAAELRFEAAGVVLCKRTPSRSRRGDCLFHLGCPLDA